jgi:hypothetical protein
MAFALLHIAPQAMAQNRKAFTEGKSFSVLYFYASNSLACALSLSICAISASTLSNF